MIGKLGFILLAASTTITRCEGDTSTFNANGGDHINIIMVADGHQLERCNDMNGELIYYPRSAFPTRPDSLRWVCEDIEF